MGHMHGILAVASRCEEAGTCQCYRRSQSGGAAFVGHALEPRRLLGVPREGGKYHRAARLMTPWSQNAALLEKQMRAWGNSELAGIFGPSEPGPYNCLASWGHEFWQSPVCQCYDQDPARPQLPGVLRYAIA